MGLNGSVAINGDPPTEKSKGCCSELAKAGGQLTPLFGRDSKEWESLVVEKKKRNVTGMP